MRIARFAVEFAFVIWIWELQQNRSKQPNSSERVCVRERAEKCKCNGNCNRKLVLTLEHFRRP